MGAGQGVGGGGGAAGAPGGVGGNQASREGECGETEARSWDLFPGAPPLQGWNSAPQHGPHGPACAELTGPEGEQTHQGEEREVLGQHVLGREGVSVTGPRTPDSPDSGWLSHRRGARGPRACCPGVASPRERPTRAAPAERPRRAVLAAGKEA